MCDPYVKECLLTVILQSSRRDIQPCIVSSVDFSLKVIFVDWQKCGFGLNVSSDLSLIIYASRVSHLSCSSLKCSYPVCMRLWSTEFVSPQAQWVGMSFTFHPHLIKTTCVNSCLFSAYPISLIGKADSQEDAPLLFWVVVAQGSVSLIVHHG